MSPVEQAWVMDEESGYFMSRDCALTLWTSGVQRYF
jgi:hypothetical protein